MDLKKKLGLRIKELREINGISQEFIAEKLNMHPANYWRIENGISYPKPENLEKISQILNVKPQDLFAFEHFDDFDTIRAELNTMINNDKDLALLLYKFAKTLRG